MVIIVYMMIPFPNNKLQHSVITVLSLFCSIIVSTGTTDKHEVSLNTFPNHPIESELKIGRHCCSKKKNITDLYFYDIQNFSNLKDRQDEPQYMKCLWLSPRLLSRWLGYLQDSEHLSEDEILHRWNILKDYFDKNLVFIIQNVSFPFKAQYSGQKNLPADSNLFDKLKYDIHFGKKKLTPEVTILTDWKLRDKKLIDSYRWWLYVPFSKQITPASMNEKVEPMYMLGSNLVRWDMLTFNTNAEITEDKLIKFEVNGFGSTRWMRFYPNPSKYRGQEIPKELQPYQLAKAEK